MAPTIAIARRVSALEGLVHLRVLSRDEIGTWRGRHDFVHRLKPLMIRDLTGRVRDEKLLYVDVRLRVRRARLASVRTGRPCSTGCRDMLRRC